MATTKVLVPRNRAPGFGLEKDLATIKNPGPARPIAPPPSDLETLSSPTGGDSFTFKSFTTADAYELGHLLHARLLPLALHEGTPTLISIALANAGVGGGAGATPLPHIVFHATAGAGTNPDNESWVARKRNAVLRYGRSTWFLRCKFGAGVEGDEAFRKRMGLAGTEAAAAYAIHGGGVPLRVAGVDGVVAVVVVSGLQQELDHAVIGEVIRENWDYEEA